MFGYHSYRIEFYSHGIRYSETVSAQNSYAARCAIMARYPGAQIASCVPVS